MLSRSGFQRQKSERLAVGFKPFGACKAVERKISVCRAPDNQVVYSQFIFYGLEFGLDPCVLRRTKQECIEPQTVVGEDINTRALRITVLILSRRVPSLLRSYRIQSYEP